MPRSRMITQESGALRRRVAHLIDTVTFDPPGMSPSSILLVRRLSDPLPRRLTSHPEAVRADSEWESAARSRLSEFYRRAARPVHGFVPGSADAIVFTDQSELLACLARDIVGGHAAMLWWWRAILRNLPAGMMEALVAAWRRDARYVPAALHLLHMSGEAVRLLTKFSPTQAWNVLQDVAREFAISLPSPYGVPFTHIQASLRDSGPAEFKDQHHHSVPDVEKTSTHHIAGPWHKLTNIPAIPDSLGRERSALLGVSLLLHCAPQTARTTRFAQTFSAWYHHVEAQRIQRAADSPPAPLPQVHDEKSVASGTVSPSLINVRPQREAVQDTTEVPAFDGHTRVVSDEQEKSAGGSLESSGELDRATEPPMVTEAALRELQAGPTPTIEPFSQETPQARRIQWITQEEARTATTGEAGPRSELSAIPSVAGIEQPQNLAPLYPTEREAIPTELGGVLFLVNLVLSLKLPELCEAEFGVGPVSGWDLLELLARSLLGHRECGFANDGVWSVLAELAGRSPGDPIAAEFQPQQCYLIPSSWMDALGSHGTQVFGVRLRSTHLQLWHPQGFMLADCLGHRALSQAGIQQECRLYCHEDELPTLSSWREIAKPALAGCGNAFMKSRALQRFLAFLLPYVRWRLCLALGLSNARALPETLLLRSGYLHATRTHLDLTMNLNQATAPVRMAGLDSDPGWVPRLARVIKFSFVTEGCA